MGTVFVTAVSVNGWRNSKMVAQALSVRKEPDQQLKEAARSWLVLSAKLFILGA
jgi:hypothetical protein